MRLPMRRPTESAGPDDGFLLEEVFESQRDEKVFESPRDQDVVETLPGEGGEDGPRSHPPTSIGDGRGIGRWVVAVAVVLVLALNGALLLRLRTGDGSFDVSPAARPAKDVASPPAGLPATGSLVLTRLSGSGEVVVDQWIRTSVPLSRLVVQAPKQADGARGARVGDITAVAEGQVASGVRDEASSSVQFVFGVPADLIRLRYKVTDAVERSDSAPGRALVRTAFVSVDNSPRLGPTVVNVAAPEVLSMSCVRREQPLTTPRPCGSPVSGGWQVTLPDGGPQDQVMAQVDLDG